MLRRPGREARAASWAVQQAWRGTALSWTPRRREVPAGGRAGSRAGQGPELFRAAAPLGPRLWGEPSMDAWGQETAWSSHAGPWQPWAPQRGPRGPPESYGGRGAAGLRSLPGTLAPLGHLWLELPKALALLARGCPSYASEHHVTGLALPLLAGSQGRTGQEAEAVSADSSCTCRRPLAPAPPPTDPQTLSSGRGPSVLVTTCPMPSSKGMSGSEAPLSLPTAKAGPGGQSARQARTHRCRAPGHAAVRGPTSRVHPGPGQSGLRWGGPDPNWHQGGLEGQCLVGS